MNLFIVALPAEIEFEYTKEFECLDKKIYQITPNNILIFSDVGKVNATYTTLLALTQFPKIKNVFNLGTCGTDKFLENLTVLNVQLTQFLDVDLTIFEDYQLNQIPREQKHFYTNKPIFKRLNELLLDEGYKVISANIGTSDTFITKTNIDKFLDTKFCQGFEMECASIAMVCKRLGINFNAIKIISDNVRNPSSEEQFKENLDVVKNMFSNIISIIVKNSKFFDDIENLDENDDDDKLDQTDEYDDDYNEEY